MAQKQQKVIANDKQNLERRLKDEIRLAKVAFIFCALEQ